MAERDNCWSRYNLLDRVEAGAVAGGLLGVLEGGIGIIPGALIGGAAGGGSYLLNAAACELFSSRVNTATPHLPDLQIDGPRAATPVSPASPNPQRRR